MTHANVLAAREQLARDRVRVATASLAERIGIDRPQERNSREPLASEKSVEIHEHLAVMAEALVALAGDLDELTTARMAAKGAR